MPEPLMIRDEVPADAEGVRRLVTAAFGQPDEAELVALLRQRQQCLLALVAEVHGELCGHLMVSPIRLQPPGSGRYAAIAPVAVSPPQQRRGVGSALMTAAIERCRGDGIDALFLLGEPAYYRRFGFTSSHLGNEYGATDAFMHLELAPGALQGVRGVACYADAFAATAS